MEPFPLWSEEQTAENNRYERQMESARSWSVSSRMTGGDLRYEILRLVDDTNHNAYNFSLVIINPKHVLATSLGSFESADGEYMPALVDISIHPPLIDEMHQVAAIMQEHNLEIEGFSYPQGVPFDCPIDDYRMQCLVRTIRYYFSVRMYLGEYVNLRPETRILDHFAPLIDGWKQVVPFLWHKTHLGILEHEDYMKTDTTKFFCGVKIYPLRPIHNMTSLPILTPWNELYCMQVIIQMRMRMICPYFPQYYGNLRVKNTNIHLFQNKELIQRFRSNADALDKINKIREQLALEQDTTILETLDTQKKQLEATGLLSGEVVTIYMEHVPGWSVWMSRYRIIERNGILEYQTILFDIMYALYVMSIQHILHTDLHLNNVLIELSYMFQYRLAADHVTLPLPSPEALRALDDSIRGGVEGAAEYEPDLNITADIKIGHVDTAPTLAPTPHGTFVCAAPRLSTTAKVIDFSRAAVMNPHAYDGVQAYRAHLLEVRNKSVYQLYTLVREELGRMSKSKIDFVTEQQFLDIAEDHPQTIFHCMEGSDFFMFIGRFLAVVPDVASNKPFMEKSPEHKPRLEALRQLLSGIYHALSGLLRTKFQQLADSRFDILDLAESVYPQLIHKFCHLLRDLAIGKTINPADSPNMQRAIGVNREAQKKLHPELDDAALEKLLRTPIWARTYSCVAEKR